MQLSEIITQWRSIINETDAANSHFTDAVGKGWANEAMRFIITRLEELPIQWNELVAALGDITVSTDTVLINEAYILNPETNKYDPLEIVDYSYLKYVSPTWLSDDVGTPKYLARKGTFAVYLFPQPKSTYVTQTVKTAGIQFPTELSADVDVPSLPKQTHDWIPHYMAHRAFEQLGMDEKSVNELVLVQGLIKSMKNITNKFSTENDQWRVTEDNDC